MCCVVLALANGAFSLVFSAEKPSLTLAAVLVIVMATAFPPAFGALNFVLLGELFPPVHQSNCRDAPVMTSSPSTRRHRTHWLIYAKVPAGGES